MSKFYIATAIPYVNDKPHIGHAMDFTYADVLARYARQNGKEVAFSIGTDEHGGKIAEKALENNITPQVFVDGIVAKWQEFASLASISNTHFLRTTSTEHEKRAQIIWKNLSSFIYKNSYIGLYCVGCEEYKTETYAKETNGVCPNHNRPYERLEEENYFFALSKFAPEIKKQIEDGTFTIIPSSKKQEILNVINDGLEDISISRPKDKLSWGIPVPGDEKHVMYVWFEALMNYITVLGYPDGEDFKKYWPADVQVIGKDILRFHAAIWPAMLLGLGLPLPKVLYVHGFVSSNGQKMSKTLGNVIDPTQLISDYGVDAFRYYLLRHIPSYDDGDFTQEKFESAYNNELANELGNALQRVVSMIHKYFNGVIGETAPATHDTGEYHQALAQCRFDRALEEVWEQVRGLNQYIDTEKPWEIAKNGDNEHLKDVLSYSANCLLEISEMLEPLLPTTSIAIKGCFEGAVVGQPSSLFPKREQ